MCYLSIITINYNNAKGLKETIESVLTQTSDDFEYLVIDGGSTDGSVEVINQYKHKITYWVSETDRGIFHAMNKGILKAKGVFCQFLNSGDTLIAPSVVERMLYERPDCSILIGNMLSKLPNGKIYNDKGSAAKNAAITLFTFYRGTLNHSSAYIKRNLFDTYGFYDESLKIVSDWKFYLIAVGLNNELVEYRDIDVTLFDRNGISNNQIGLLKEERRKVLKELIPKNILADYDQYWFDIEQMKRLKSFRLTKWPIWFIERVLFKLEKWRLLKS